MYRNTRPFKIKKHMKCLTNILSLMTARGRLCRLAKKVNDCITWCDSQKFWGVMLQSASPTSEWQAFCRLPMPRPAELPLLGSRPVQNSASKRKERPMEQHNARWDWTTRLQEILLDGIQSDKRNTRTRLLWSLTFMMRSFLRRSHTEAFPPGLAEARMCWTCLFHATQLMSSTGFWTEKSPTNSF